MRIIKRNGSETAFDISKIIAAITRANDTVDESLRLTPTQIREIADNVVAHCEELGRSPNVEEVQDMVEKQIMAHGAYDVAKNYITYRYTRALVRQSNTTDDKILEPYRMQQRRGQAGELKQKPGGQLHPARLHGGRGVARYNQPHSAAAAKLSRRITRASSTFTTPTTLPSICTTATW